jgi:hypothetical protein
MNGFRAQGSSVNSSKGSRAAGAQARASTKIRLPILADRFPVTAKHTRASEPIVRARPSAQRIEQ